VQYAETHHVNNRIASAYAGHRSSRLRDPAARNLRLNEWLGVAVHRISRPSTFGAPRLVIGRIEPLIQQP
jgi:hypothetical protein